MNTTVHRTMLPLLACLLAMASPAATAAAKGGAKPAKSLVMLISLDGLKPEAVLAATDHGLKVPNLRAFLTAGAYATGVRGVLPTVTYPSHMTLLTGTSPGRHGIYANTTFDPLNRNEKGWYWYAEDGRVPTLWSAAARPVSRRPMCTGPPAWARRSDSTCLRSGAPAPLMILSCNAP